MDRYSRALGVSAPFIIVIWFLYYIPIYYIQMYYVQMIGISSIFTFLRYILASFYQNDNDCFLNLEAIIIIMQFN